MAGPCGSTIASKSEGFIFIIRLGVVLVLIVSIFIFEVAGCDVSFVGMPLYTAVSTPLLGLFLMVGGPSCVCILYLGILRVSFGPVSQVSVMITMSALLKIKNLLKICEVQISCF